MLFNSIEFSFFLPLVFSLYWLSRKNTTVQNLLLVVASYVFYGCWNWKFLSLIAISSFADYFLAILISRSEGRQQRKLYLAASIAVNIGILGFFKYYNFFLESFADAFTLFGNNFDPGRLNIILPVGISFYTFQTMSYTIDVYRKKIQPTHDILAVFAFVSFFPQLVAGPIERASNLLPQFCKKRNFEYHKAVDGLRQILWGLFKKIVIADNCAILVNEIFQNYTQYDGSMLLLGAIFFAFQIYGDFSGYSDIAIGTARLFGFDLMKNFAFPYFSRDIAEFWRRWHISLSTWFRDYLYIPLGGSRGSTLFKIRNVFIIFLVSGLWHGANWTFVAWGFLNALYFLPLMLLNANRQNLGTVASNRLLPNAMEVMQVGFTFFITLIAWVFFRSATIMDALIYCKGIFSPSLFTMPDIAGNTAAMICIGFIAVLTIAEWFQRNKEHGLEFAGQRVPVVIRWGIYLLLIVVIFYFGGKQQEFIYFQF